MNKSSLRYCGLMNSQNEPKLKHCSSIRPTTGTKDRTANEQANEQKPKLNCSYSLPFKMLRIKLSTAPLPGGGVEYQV